MYVLFTKTFSLIADLPVYMWYIKQEITISDFIRQRPWKRKRLWWRLLGWSDMFSYWWWTAEVDLHHHSCHRSLLSSDCSHFSNYRIQVANQAQEWKVKSTTIYTNELAPKMKRIQLVEVASCQKLSISSFSLQLVPNWQYPPVPISLSSRKPRF